MHNWGHKRQGSLGTTLSTLNLGHHRSHSLLTQNNNKLQTMHNLKEITGYASKLASRYNLIRESHETKENNKFSDPIKLPNNKNTKNQNTLKESNAMIKIKETFMKEDLSDLENKKPAKFSDKIINMYHKRENRRSSTTEVKRAFADISNKTIDGNIAALAKMNSKPQYVFDS